MSDVENETTVAVTSKGQATIPKRFRDKLHIETPGRVRFVETEDGEIVIRSVKRPAEIRGALAGEADDDRTATQQLRDERECDKRKTEGKVERSASDE